MKRIVYILITALFFAVGCSKKEKKYIPFSNSTGDSAPTTQSTANASATGATLSQISVSPANQSIAKDTHATYVATGIYSDGTIKDISTECSWAVKSETDKASTVASKKGRFLGVAATATGTPAKVSASFGSLSGDANLNITTATLSSIQISSVPSLVPGGTAQYIATGIFSDGTTQDVSSLVTWSSNATSSVTIDATTGIGTGGSSSGTATISATISTATFPTVANGGVATTSTTLKNVTVVSITVTGNASVSAGSTNSYLASVIYSDGTSEDITTRANWSLSSSSNASINDNTGSKGILTAISAGSVNVQATYIGLTGTKAVTISSVTVSSVIVSPSTKTIANGTTTQFTATATYSDGTSADVTNSAVWSSSNTAIAGVNTSTSTGGLTQGIAAGSSTITATTGGKSGSAALTVSSATLVSIAIGGNVSIAKGTTKQYTATGTYSDASTQDITSLVSWTSSSTSNASISNASGTKGLATGVAQGTSTIQASLSGINSNTSTLTITPATLSSIAISASASIENGATKQYAATGTFSDATTQDITSLVTWNSATPATATISNAVSDKGKAYALAVGSTNITATLANGTNGIVTGSGNTVTSNTSVLTVSAPATATTTNSTLAGYNVTVPSGMTIVSPATGGTGFSGITYQGNPSEVAGFVSEVSYTSGSGCANFGAALLTSMINDTPNYITINNQISSSIVGTSPDCSAVYNLGVTVNTSMTVTELSNHLISQIGKLVPGGTITNLPISAGTETAGTTFRVILQATYSSSGNELVGVGVSREANYASNATLLNSLLDGTNINPSGSTNTSKTDSFTATADPKVDFVWMVDNSSSMSAEQSLVQANAATFFTKLSTKHLDFRLGVITTGSKDLGDSTKCTMTPTGAKAWELWGTGWTTSADGSSAFVSNVATVGTNGCGSDETAPFFMERALGAHTGVAATVVPRSGAQLVFVILTDEGDGYATMAAKSGANAPSGTFNPNSNIFVTNGYKVYSIIGIYDGTVTVAGGTIGQPGRCDTNTGNSTAPEATNSNNDAGALVNYQLAAATGGSSSTICTTDYSAILDNIATQAAGSASAYNLSKIPVSSTIVVKVNGTTVTQDATNGWQYNASNQSIVFSGTAWPTAGAAITVSYEYNSSVNVAFGGKGGDSLMAYISKTAKSDTARGAAAAIAILVGAILAGRIWNSRKHS